MKSGQFYVRELMTDDFKLTPVLVPVSDEDAKEMRGLAGQVFQVSLDDEAPLNDRQRAFLFAHVRDWIASLPDPVRRVFWRFFHSHNYAPVDARTVIDVLKKMYGIESIANGRCSRQELSEFVQWAEQRLAEIGAAAADYREGNE